MQYLYSYGPYHTAIIFEVIAAKDAELGRNREEIAVKDEVIAALKEQLQKLQQPAEGEPPV